MTTDEARLLEQALRLPSEVRADLAERLLVSVEDEQDDLETRALEVRLRERARQLETGEVAGVPDDEARRRLRSVANGFQPKT